MKRRNGLWTLVSGDIRAKAAWLYDRDDRNACLRALFADGTAAMLLYRCMQWAGTKKLAPLEMLFNKLCVLGGGCVIGRGAEFGERFVLIHSNGVVINGAVRGGDDVRLEHQVTIGAEGGESPQLGNNVFVGAGAKILGSVHIGDDAKIGANAVVTKSVSCGATAVGVPARELPRSSGTADSDSKARGGKYIGQHGDKDSNQNP
ncbi:MAG: DapH/DapD/GlmU-related protein [Pseudomonadota bacterium]